MKNIEISAPPSKSMSHRAVIAAALAAGESHLRGVLKSDDLDRTIETMVQCGARISSDGPGALQIFGMAGLPAGGVREPVGLDVGESGTTCRLITAIIAGGMGSFRIHGQGRMHERPIGRLTRVLQSVGVEIEWLGKPDFPPFVLTTVGLPGGRVIVDMEESSQYLSGLLLAAPMARNTLAIEIGGNKTVSWPYVALTLQTLLDFGLDVSIEKRVRGHWDPMPLSQASGFQPGEARFVVRPGNYQPGNYQVEGDWSNASYFLAAGAVGPNPVTVTGLRPDSLQGDRAILDILERMGATVAWNENGVTVSPPADGLRALDVDMGSCPDLVPTVAVTAAMAQGETVIRNVAHLRIKESDRLAALASELQKIECGVQVTEDGLRITPGFLPKGVNVHFAAHGDHRIVMSLSLLELAGTNATFDNPGCTAKSFPGFQTEWSKVHRS